MKLYNRLSSFYIVINVPKCLRKRIGKSQIWRSLHTKDRRIANLRAGMIKMSVHKLFTEEQMKEAQEIDGMLRDISCDGIGHSEMDYTEDFAEMVAYEACREKVNYAKTYLVSEMIEEYQQKLKIYRDTYKQGDYKLAYNALTVTVAIVPYVTSFVYLCDVILSIRESRPKGRFFMLYKKTASGQEAVLYVFM